MLRATDALPRLALLAVGGGVRVASAAFLLAGGAGNGVLRVTDRIGKSALCVK